MFKAKSDLITIFKRTKKKNKTLRDIDTVILNITNKKCNKITKQ